MASRTFVVLTGALSLVEGEAAYKNNLVSEEKIGGQVERHLANGAIREATTYEIKAGKANPVGEPTLEDQVDEQKATIESATAKIAALQAQIKERDAKAAPAPTAKTK